MVGEDGALTQPAPSLVREGRRHENELATTQYRLMADSRASGTQRKHGPATIISVSLVSNVTMIAELRFIMFIEIYLLFKDILDFNISYLL